MNSRKIKEIVKFNIQKNIQNKWFIIFNIVTLLIMVATSNLNNIKDFLAAKNINFFNENMSIEILDIDNLATEQLKEAFSENNFEITSVTENTYTKDTIPDDLVLVEVNKSEQNFIETKVISKDSIDSYIYEEINSVLTKVRSDLFSEKNKIEKQELEKLNEPVKMEQILLSVNAENSETKEIIKTVSTLAIYFISIFIFSKIANEIAQEKVSKSIEYVLTSITEKEYLLAKIISIIGVLLIQGIYFLIYYFTGNLINNLINISALGQTTANSSILISGIDTDIILYIITTLTYGILTLILMSIIQAALSSKTTSMEEAGNTTGLLSTITILAYFVTLLIITPYTKMNAALYILSCIPLLSNYFIPAILVIGQATPVQIIISLVLLIISIPITFNICATIFKNGVLDYKPTKKNKNRKTKKQLSFIEEQELDLTKKKFRKIGFIVGIAIIIYLSTSIIFSLIYSLLIAPVLSNFLNLEQLNLLNLVLDSLLSLGLASLFILSYVEKNTKIKKASLKDSLRYIVEGIFLIGLFQILLAYVNQLLGVDYNIVSTIEISDTSNLLTNILFFTCLAIVPAIFEELLFRKAIISATKEISVEFAIVFSSLLFGIIHMNLGQTIFAFLLGLVFSYIYVKTNNIFIPITLHLLNNGFASLLLLITIDLTVWGTFIILGLFAIIIVLAFLGFISLLLRARKACKNKTLKLSINKEEIKNSKYIFTDYTFIIALTFIILMFACTENMLRMGL